MTSSNDRDEFFIGYDPPLPSRLSTFITRVVAAGSAAIALSAAAIAAGHVRLDGGSFEFGQTRTIRGTIVTRPYPALVEDAPDADGRAHSWRLLVAPGKHGADALMRGLSGARVEIEGTRIERAGLRMIEVRPDSVVRVRAVSTPGFVSEFSDLSQAVTLRGEIVDSKCFLGVMTPGDGRTHAACASLCLRGGIPPVLLVRDRAGRSALYLLEDPKGDGLALRAAAIAGEPVDVGGVIGQRGPWRILRTDPSTWTRLAEAR